MTEELSRTSALASRHTELGSGLEDWNSMGTAWSYNSDPNDEDVGIVNSPCWSHRLNKSLALVHLRPDAAKPGTLLEVSSGDFNGTAVVEETPFFDPSKSRTHA